PSISLALVPIGAWVAISRWTELRKSSRTLIICWALSIVVPLLIALLPIDAIYDVDSVRATDIANGLTASQAGADIFSARVLLAFTPWLFVLRRKIYGRSMSIAEAQAELPKAGRLGGYLTFAGFALVVIFMLTAKVEGMRVVGSDSNKAVFSYLQVGRTAVE